jgi:hypothetical protein
MNAIPLVIIILMVGILLAILGFVGLLDPEGRGGSRSLCQLLFGCALVLVSLLWLGWRCWLYFASGTPFFN